MEKLKAEHPEEVVGDKSHESGEILLSPSSILYSRENSSPEEGTQITCSKIGHDLLIQFLK